MTHDFLAFLPPDQHAEARYLFEERAGIHMDSHATREDAERMALEEVKQVFQIETGKEQQELML